jgi:hypothetical protein
MGRRGIAVAAVLMIVFGLVEIVTAFTHRFFGISTAEIAASTNSAAAIGALYIAAGVLVLTMRKWAAALALLCLILDIAGRVGLVVLGLFPLDSVEQIIAIVAGTLIAGFFAIYIVLRWNLFA